jgi:Skp family chaperone for outer membrane proteins
MDLYGGNPFRILGVRSDASEKDTARAASRLLKWIEIGEAPQAYDALCYLGSFRRTREQVKQAVNEIENPRARIRAELFWPSAMFSGLEACDELLKKCHYDEVVQICNRSIARESDTLKNQSDSDTTLDASLSRHYLAIFYHSAAISGSHRPPSHGGPPANWGEAFKHWFLVSRDDRFWRYLADRAHALNDPRVDESAVHELRQELLLRILRINVSFAVASFERGDSAGFALNCGIIRESLFGSETEQALKEVTAPLQLSFEKASKQIMPALSEGAIRARVGVEQPANLGLQYNEEGEKTFVGNETEREVDPQKLTAYLGGFEKAIDKSLIPIARSVREAKLEATDAGNMILDGVAYVFRSLSLAFNNLGGMPHASLRLTKVAKEYAVTAECKERLDEDRRTLEFVSLQKDASDLAAESRYRESLQKLEAAREVASSDQERRQIEEWIQIAKKRVALEGAKPIDRAPTMSTVNGIGTRLYGKRDYDPESQTYVATLYFTFVFVPILPLSAYRVRYAGGNRYQFLGRVPLKWTAFLGPAIAALVIALFLFQGNTNTTPAPTATQDSTGYIGTTAPSQTNEQETLGEWINRERARLTTEQSDLDGERNHLDAERRTLDQTVEELNSGTPTQDEIDSYEAARQRFNTEVEDFNARMEKHKADVAEFNAQVNRYNDMP